MITIVYSTHKDSDYNQKFKKHLEYTVGLPYVQILEYINKNEFSLSQIYNRGIQESNYDIVCCIHNDIKLEKDWGKKLLEDFNKNPDFSIIGKAGSCYFPDSGIYWEKMNSTMVGQVYHNPEPNKKWLSQYSPKLPFLVEVVTIDGLFISFNKIKIKHNFDETIGKFHFYDHGFCLPNYLDGLKIGVTSSFEIIHNSVGMPNQEFFESKIKFVEKYKKILPLELKPNQVYFEFINEKPIKNIGKVAIIIPTKENFELLINCLESFYKNSNPDLFEIFIADTGSSDKTKDRIKNFISKYPNINFIQYDYYHFAKINNDVVKNHVDKKFEFLLFCNNDIKILNNVVYGMLKIFKSNPKVGTVGSRLHFGDNTIQHDGIFLKMNKDSKLYIGHMSLGSFYNFNLGLKQVIGSTAALMMIRKNIFDKIGGFNENYSTCFEDVELNLECINHGLINFCDGSLVAYHYESQTRKLDKLKQEKELLDYNNHLIPYINKNINKFIKYFI